MTALPISRLTLPELRAEISVGNLYQESFPGRFTVFRNLFGAIPAFVVKALIKLALELYPRFIAISEIVPRVVLRITFARFILVFEINAIGERPVSFKEITDRLCWDLFHCKFY